MVTKIVNGNGAGDLRNAADWFGIEDDRIVVQMAGGAIHTMAGNDIVDVSQAAGSGGQIVYLGFGNDAVYGGGGGDLTYDGDGNDFATLGAGDDFAVVGGGNDILIGGAGIDTLNFEAESFDGVGIPAPNYSGVRVDLATITAQNFGVFGMDVVAGFENVTGGGGNDVLYGTTGINELYGGAGNDRLDGRAGIDTIVGGFGADTLIGGAGKDRLYGGDGKAPDTSRDRFVYTAMSDSGLTAATRDDIYTFTRGTGADGDRIDLHRIDADPSKPGNQAFSFGTSFHANRYGEIRVLTQGTDTLVLVDIDRDAAAEMTFLVHGVNTLSASDFIL